MHEKAEVERAYEGRRGKGVGKMELGGKEKEEGGKEEGGRAQYGHLHVQGCVRSNDLQCPAAADEPVRNRCDRQALLSARVAPYTNGSSSLFSLFPAPAGGQSL